VALSVLSFLLVLPGCTSLSGGAAQSRQSPSSAPQASGLSESPSSAASSAALCAWAGGEGGIFATTDGGETWQRQYSSSDAVVNGLSFSDSTHGWAAGSDGLLLSTTDGGVTWQDRSLGEQSAPYAWLVGVACVDAQHVWVVGEHTYATSDGGDSWMQRHSQENLAVAADEAGRVWVAGGTTLVRSSDGGATWADVYPDGCRATLLDVTTRGREVYVVSSTASPTPKPVMLASSNGGETWTTRTLATWGTADGVATSSTSHAWAISEGRTVTSRDGGGHWDIGWILGSRSASSDYCLNGIAFGDHLHGWAVGERVDAAGDLRGVVFATTDGGTTWRLQAVLPASMHLNTVTCCPFQDR